MIVAIELSIPSSVWLFKYGKDLTSYIHTDESLTVPKSILFIRCEIKMVH